MARVMGPFMSLDASGTIFGTLTASIWKGRNYIKGYTVPTNPNTALQQAQRALFGASVAAWQSLIAVPEDPQITSDYMIKSVWNTFGATCQPPISGANAFVKWYIAEAGTITSMPPAPFIGKKGIR